MDDDLKGSLKRIWNEYQRSKEDPVRIGFLGQPGAGKSSLINSILGYEAAPVGVETDYTKGAADYSWNELSLVDLPGYGTEGFPREGFIEKFKLLDHDALLCISNGKFRSDDLVLFREVLAQGKACVFVRTHSSSLNQSGKTREQLESAIYDDLNRQLGRDDVPVVFVDNATQDGMAKLQDLVAGFLKPARRAKYYRWAQGTSDEFLKKKRDSCNSLIQWFAAGAAANGLNPIPGTDIAVDLAIVGKMYVDILGVFGFTRELLQDYVDRYEMLRPIIMPVLNTLIRGAVALLAGFAGGAFAKWLPLVGPALAASTGAAIVYGAGHSFADQCLKMATGVRDAELERNEAA